MDLGLVWLVLLVPIVIVVLFLLSGLFLVGQNQVGILTRRMGGKKMPQGQVVARHGEVGVQADTLVPGLYFRMPLFWQIQKDAVVVIPEFKIGVVEEIDGIPLPAGRVVGDETECNQFQDAEKFLNGGGHKGPQAGILRPGTYRINTRAFHITITSATSIAMKKSGSSSHWMASLCHLT